MKAVAYIEPMKVEIQDIEYPGLELKDGPGVHPANVGRQTPHGVILKLVATNICGSDQHMVRGRTTAPPGLILGHEITGEVVECGRDVEFIKVGDLVSVPFNIDCGRCRNCEEGKTGICLNVNPARAGAASSRIMRPSRNDDSRCGASRKSSADRLGGVSTMIRSHSPPAASWPSFSIAMYSWVPENELEMVR